jgi:hypothetical protein
MAYGSHIRLVLRTYGRPISDKFPEHGNLEATVCAYGFRPGCSCPFFVSDVKFSVRVWAKHGCEGLKLFFECRPCPGTSHGAFHAQAQSYFFKFFAMAMLAVIYGMYKFMDQRIQHFNRFTEYGGYEDLIDVISTALSGPALTYVATFKTCTGKSA